MVRTFVRRDALPGPLPRCRKAAGSNRLGETVTLTSRLRIASGIVLFVFVFGHLISVAFGLWSLEAMEWARVWIMGPWTNPIGGPILLISLLLHMGLGLWALYWRNTLWMNWSDSAQALLGLAILPLLMPHLVGTGFSRAFVDIEPTFSWVLAVYWIFAPALGIQQVIALIVIWLHGCYGLFLWMQVQSWWPRIAGFLYPLVVVVPMAALLGFVSAGKFLFINRDDATIMAPVRQTAAQYDQIVDALWTLHDRLLAAYLVLVAVVLLARAVRVWRRGSEVSVEFAGGPTIERQAGLTLLETARADHIDHAGLCGGRGRCGSCSVRVLAGGDDLSPASAGEIETLRRIGAAADVRLACQAKALRRRVVVQPVYPADIMPEEYQARLRGAASDQAELAEDAA